MEGTRRRLGTVRRTACGWLALMLVVLVIPAAAHAATWIGTTHGKITRSNKWVSGTSTWHGDFWLETGRGGTVRGEAVIGYEPAIDVSGLNNVITYLKTEVGAIVDPLLGPFAPAVGAIGLNQIVGVSVSFNESMAVRRGTLTGTLHGGRLSLTWGARIKGIPYNITFDLISGTKPIGGGNAPLHNPFLGAGRIGGPGHAVSTSESRSTSGGVTQTVGSYWVANRVR
jgi:hypothetical protein